MVNPSDSIRITTHKIPNNNKIHIVWNSTDGYILCDAINLRCSDVFGHFYPPQMEFVKIFVFIWFIQDLTRIHACKICTTRYSDRQDWLRPNTNEKKKKQEKKKKNDYEWLCVWSFSMLYNFVFSPRRCPQSFGKFVCQDNILINKRQSYFLFRHSSPLTPLTPLTAVWPTPPPLPPPPILYLAWPDIHMPPIFVCAIVKNSPWSAKMKERTDPREKKKQKRKSGKIHRNMQQ